MKKYSKFLLAFLMVVKAQDNMMDRFVEIAPQLGPGSAFGSASETSSVHTYTTNQKFNSIDDILDKRAHSKEERKLLEKYEKEVSLYSEYAVFSSLINGNLLYLSDSDLEKIQKIIQKTLIDCYSRVSNVERTKDAKEAAKANSEAAKDALKSLSENKEVLAVLKKSENKKSQTKFDFNVDSNNNILLNAKFFIEGEKKEVISFDVNLNDYFYQALTNKESSEIKQIILTFKVKDSTSKKHIPINIRCRFNVDAYNKCLMEDKQLDQRTKEELILKPTIDENMLLDFETSTRIRKSLSSINSAGKFFDAMSKLNIEFIVGSYFSRNATTERDNLDKAYMKVATSNNTKALKDNIALGALSHVLGIEGEMQTRSLSDTTATFNNNNMYSVLRAVESASEAFRYFVLESENNNLMSKHKKDIKQLKETIDLIGKKQTKTIEEENRIKDAKQALSEIKKNKLSAQDKAKIAHNKIEMDLIMNNAYNASVIKRLRIYYSDSATIAEIKRAIASNNRTYENATSALAGKSIPHTKEAKKNRIDANKEKVQANALAQAAKKEKTTCGC